MRRVVAYPALGFFLLFGLFCLGLAFPFQMALALVAGWATFLVRVGPGVTVSWGGVTIAVVCLAGLSILAHSFFGWLSRAIRWPEEGRWSPRWTASLVGGVVLMFVAGISAAGMGHQAGWLLTSGEPWVGDSFRHLSFRLQSSLNLKQIAIGVAEYEKVGGSMPPGASLDSDGRLLHGWQARLLPYIEESALYDRINFAVAWDDPLNEATFVTRVRKYLHPGVRDDPKAPGPAPSHYAGNVRLLGGDSARKSAEIPDGASATILAGEAAGDYKPWGYPANWRDPARGINREPGGFGGPSVGGANFLFADGSVRFLKNSIDPKVLRALSTPDGGEKISADQY